MTFDQFVQDFHLNIRATASADNENGFVENIFVEYMIGLLCEAAELDEGEVCYHRETGIKINGFGLSHEESCLDLFVAIYTGISTT